jgi:D-alanine-D-alanine ligase
MFVDKARNKKEFEQKVDDYFKKSGKPFVMVEECIVGMELTCGVFGNEDVTVLPPSYSVATGGILSIEEKFLPGAGENQTPAPISESATRFVQRVLKDVFLAIGCRGYSRIDCFYQDEKISPTGCERLIILEINTLPGLTPATCLFHQAAEVGIKPMELIDKIVQLGFEARTNLFFTESEVGLAKNSVSKSKGS